MRTIVERIVSDCVGSNVRVVSSTLLADARGRVERLSIRPHVDGVGSTVVVKARSLEQWSVVSLATEHAALGALSASDGELSPRVLGWNEQAGLLVMTDAGRRTVEDALLEGDAREAEASLVALARTLATLHAVHLDRPLVMGHQTWMIGTHAIDWETLNCTIRKLGFPPADGARDNAAALVDALLDPGRFAAFVHGDITPNNAVIAAGGRCRLVDFEGAGRQHMGIDACMLRFPFAWYRYWALVPGPVQAAMEAAYRTQINRPVEDIDHAIAVGCMAMALVRLSRLAPIDDEQQTSSQARRRRVQIASTVQVAIEAATHAAAYPELVAWLRELLGEMRCRWQEATLPPPLFPAFTTSNS